MREQGGDEARAPGAEVDDLSVAFPPGTEPPFRTPVGVLVATARRRGLRRRIAIVSARTSLFAVPVIAAMVIFGNLSYGTVGPGVEPASSPSHAPASIITATAGPAPSRSGAPSSRAAVCTAAQLSGKKTSRTGAAASHTLVEIVLTNSGPVSCQLSGYPRLAAWGADSAASGRGPSALMPTVFTHGTYLIPDPGPTTVVIAPRGHAWFGVGAGVGYPTPQVVFDKLVIEVGSAAGGKTGHVDVAVALSANGPAGKAIPVGVTAFAPGIPPRP